MPDPTAPDRHRILACTQCPGKPAIMTVGEHPLCVDCYYKVSVAQTLQFQRDAAMMNLALSEIDAIAGWAGDTYRVQMPQLPNGNTSTTNVTVSGSTVGAINTGTVHSIVVNMKALEAAGHHEVEGAIKALTEAVICSPAVGSDQKNEILEQIEFVASRAAVKPEERKPGVTKSIVAGLAASLGMFADLATIWQQVGPIIKSALGL